MPKSMTGFGSARRLTPLGVLSIEIRSVNNRFLDMMFRGLGDLRGWEPQGRERIKQRAQRGKLEINVSWEKTRDIRPQIVLNRDLINEMFAAVLEPAEQFGVTPAQLLGPIVSLPGVMEIQPPEIDLTILYAELDATLDEALDRYDEARRREGAILKADLLARNEILAEQHAFIDQNKDTVLEKYRRRLDELVTKLTDSGREALEPGRLESEVALFADRCDISEELVRLRAHIDDLTAKLNDESDEAVGKAIEFLVQELLRETNTIGSKARDTVVIKSVLELKNEIERIREQALNIE